MHHISSRSLRRGIMAVMLLFILLRCLCKVIAGSATPSLESYYNAVTGKYGLVELMQRYGDVQLPSIEMVDTRKIIQKDKAKIILSPTLIEAINETVSRNKQVILFQKPPRLCSLPGLHGLWLDTAM